MSDVVERFMRYVQVDSQSSEAGEGTVPSTPAQHNMARLLGDELEALGLQNVVVDEHAYVTASLPASPGAEEKPALGLIAHIDSASDAPGSGVRPHIVHYEGGNLVAGVVDGMEVMTTPAQVPDLALLEGQDIVCTDGTTLLSADDKAGVAEICALLARLVAHPQLPHPTLKIAFVPDEEIGHGASLLDLESFGAAWCYTVDGGPLGEVNCETFSAYMATVTIKGVAVHPGDAKNVMVNAISVSAEFDGMLPQSERPEHTEDREGFYFPHTITGSASEVTLCYMLRDFDSEKLDGRVRTMEKAAAFLNYRYGEGTVRVEVREQYRNMAEHLVGLEFLVERALQANREAGIEPTVRVVRGGTDGSQLTLRGLPCPNLATGAYNMHSVREFVPVPSLELTVDMLEHLVAKFA